MGRRRLVVGVMVVVVLSFAALAVYAAEQTKPSDEFRRQFIDSFRRTGLNTAPGDAMMLRILVEASGAKRGVEVGAASGYGAINMGIAFERTGGHLWTLEIDPRMVRQTRENIAKMGLEQTVTCIGGDALETLHEIEGPIDFVFLDAVKSDYLKYLRIIEPKLAKGAVVVGDNVIQSARAMKDFLDYLQTSLDYDTVIIRSSMDKNDGMSISYKIR
ncbi:MAG: class I SAM-dependent methyltransferase [Sedimentisphaerales bacterium]|jgi:predicted O-methyltransferase YrrM|nr:class I SAM-dependent methyltransferase [Sedimentisphaerales bacterium]HNY79447.1 class I SAM-dependent methyltransferase [Sedimentisphaerales bacterium]HOC64647.1 class I SAM-dependent methyltransferase [Sedimentisphaerales bacterium]HOH65440.1 class I SAM-dependent methyltransferase [Sedimentisphaerales bacterium]HPY48726.1 class I SAM-dependent methyltransferase [Sedimentisphaerales bacterium]